MAIVAGLIFWIKEQAFDTGKIILLFQPAEETGQGGFNVLNDEKFIQLKSDYIFALHNIPGAPLHSIITIKKGFSAEVQSFALYLKGKEAHAAEPENAINPTLCISEIITEFSKLNVNNPLTENFAILTPIHIKVGQKSYGISPSNGELHYTLRTWNGRMMESLKIKLQDIIEQKCTTHQLSYSLDFFEYFPASENNEECNQYH